MTLIFHRMFHFWNIYTVLRSSIQVSWKAVRVFPASSSSAPSDWSILNHYVVWQHPREKVRGPPAHLLLISQLNCCTNPRSILQISFNPRFSLLTQIRARVMGRGITISVEIRNWLANYENRTAYMETHRMLISARAVEWEGWATTCRCEREREKKRRRYSRWESFEFLKMCLCISTISKLRNNVGQYVFRS